MKPLQMITRQMAATLAFGLASAFMTVSAENDEAQEKDKSARHLFILSGQSNMTPMLGDSFGGCVEQVLGKEKVLVVQHGRPARPIKQWLENWTPPAGMVDPKPEENGVVYKELMNAVRHHLKDERPATVTLVWMQGEGDTNNQRASVYEKSFLALLEQIKGDLNIKELNFVVGRINDYWLNQPDGKAIRGILAKLGDDHANGAWIDTDDLNGGVNGWGGFSFNDGHFPLQAYVVIGQRMAKQACRLLDPNMKPDPSIFKEHFIDSHEQIQTHAAIGKTVTGGTSVLTDGNYGPADHTSKAWVEYSPSEEPIEIIVDLGEPVVVDQIGVNMLLSSEALAVFPTKLTYSTSEDGKTFKVHNERYNNIQYAERKSLNKMRADGVAPQSILLLTQQRDRGGPVTASKIKITIETGEQHVYLDEIVVNPIRK